jgi:hypothetical protein
MKRRFVISVLAGLVVFAAVFAMAASLGGITSGTVGADTTTVAACDSNGVTAAYTVAWDATDERYEISTVTVGGVADTCDGLTLSVTLADSGGAQIGSGSLTIPASGATSFGVSMAPQPSANATVGIHVAIA